MLNTPIAYALHDQPSLAWSQWQGMSTVLAYDTPQIEARYQAIAGICDVSCLPRFAIKGPNAMQWLAQHGIAIPEGVNSWLALDEVGQVASVVLKLGSSEFIIEDQFKGSACTVLALAAGSQQPIATGVYKVQRNDAAFMLSGSQLPSLLSELCMLDLSPTALPEQAVIMTQVAGISATLLRQTLQGETVYRLWCDGTYGPYMWQTLTQIAAELGGGPVGLAHYTQPQPIQP